MHASQHRNRFVLLSSLFVVGLAIFIASAAAETGCLLSGTITSASGQKMEGVSVSVRADGKTITTTVFTNEQGEYISPRLPDGSYKVWAQAEGFEAGRASLQLSGATKQQDFALTALKSANDVGKQMTGAEWLESLPADTPQDKKMREMFSDSCTGCHTPGFPLQNRFDAKGWAAMITLMSRVDGFGGYTGDKVLYPAFDRYKTDLAAYLAKVRGPNSVLQPKLHLRPKGEATLAVVTEYAPGRHGRIPRFGGRWQRLVVGQSLGIAREPQHA